MFVGLLNVSHLGTDQSKKFTGYIYYDSLKPESTRLDELTVLHNKGILNMIVFANFVYGTPRMTKEKIKKMIYEDENSFARIQIPKDDFVVQTDGANCGIFHMDGHA